MIKGFCAGTAAIWLRCFSVFLKGLSMACGKKGCGVKKTAAKKTTTKKKAKK
jgi:hypothetical protein